VVTNGGDNRQAICGHPRPTEATKRQVSCALARLVAGRTKAQMSMVRRRCTVRFRKGARQRPTSNVCALLFLGLGAILAGIRNSWDSGPVIAVDSREL
jgi:hypothetical protein